MMDKCAAALRAKVGGVAAQVDEKKTSAMQAGTVLQSSEVGKLVHWDKFEDFEKAVKSKNYTLSKQVPGPER
eukprot:COSAG02_NODE_348_length_24081_cov_19.231007_11_plen_72_part_00